MSKGILRVKVPKITPKSEINISPINSTLKEEVKAIPNSSTNIFVSLIKDVLTEFQANLNEKLNDILLVQGELLDDRINEYSEVMSMSETTIKNGVTEITEMLNKISNNKNIDNLNQVIIGLTTEVRGLCTSIQINTKDTNSELRKLYAILDEQKREIHHCQRLLVKNRDSIYEIVTYLNNNQFKVPEIKDLEIKEDLRDKEPIQEIPIVGLTMPNLKPKKLPPGFSPPTIIKSMLDDPIIEPYVPTKEEERIDYVVNELVLEKSRIDDLEDYNDDQKESMKLTIDCEIERLYESAREEENKDVTKRFCNHIINTTKSDPLEELRAKNNNMFRSTGMNDKELANLWAVIHYAKFDDQKYDNRSLTKEDKAFIKGKGNRIKQIQENMKSRKIPTIQFSNCIKCNEQDIEMPYEQILDNFKYNYTLLGI